MMNGYHGDLPWKYEASGPLGSYLSLSTTVIPASAPGTQCSHPASLQLLNQPVHNLRSLACGGRRGLGKKSMGTSPDGSKQTETHGQLGELPRQPDCWNDLQEAKPSVFPLLQTQRGERKGRRGEGHTCLFPFLLPGTVIVYLLATGGGG